ncbi:MAG: hypothetical protein NTW14_12925 [bacterium]|nr:hypothetical protein [bacterium]
MPELESDATPSLTYRENYVRRVSEENHLVFDSPYFWDVEPEDLPLDPRRRLPGFERAFLEIGFGHGEVLEQLIQQYPRTAFIGIEKRPYRVRKALKRLKRIGSPNAALLRLNLDLIDGPLFFPGSFDHILINHPDPWPKPRQKHHRFFDVQRVEWLTALLTKGGTLKVASDHTEYFFHILGLLELNPDLESHLPAPFYTSWPEPDRPMSRYERNRRAAGEIVRMLRFTKVK